MIHWKETAEVLARLAELAATGPRAALATVVRISGSAYRRPGARMLIEEGGAALGSVSGGCLEADVREVAQAVIAGGLPSLRHYSTAGDEDLVFGLGMGCYGLVDVLVQPATSGPLAELAGRLHELLAGEAPFALLTTLDEGEELGTMRLLEPGERAPEVPRTDRSGVQEVAGRAVFVERFRPPPHLVVCGAGDDAMPLVAYAADAGFRVTVVDHRPALLELARFPRAARLLLARPEEADLALPPAARSLAVVKTHALAHDREWVRRLLAAGFPYVGLLGPRERTASILHELGAEGDERVFGPVGLDLGAEGPWQVALSIVAELLAFNARREPRHLTLRDEAIHVG